MSVPYCFMSDMKVVLVSGVFSDVYVHGRDVRPINDDVMMRSSGALT
jgi:hypothetical protein